MDDKLREEVTEFLTKLAAEIQTGQFAADLGAFGVAAIEIFEENGITFRRIPLTEAQAIAANQVIPAPMTLKREDSVLELRDQAGEMADDIGPPVVFPRYTAPKDPRVQQVLKDAAAARRAELTVPREIFRDPRLEPDYRPPKAKK